MNYLPFNTIFERTIAKHTVRIFLLSARNKSSVRQIDKLLIANRGEIACRVIKTANKLGIRSVSVYSEVDKNSLHVSLASEAYEIGPPPASQSYLKGEKILEIAKKSGCQAIHPGYGFLSENVEFAELCQREGVIFIGPPASAIRDMGIKSTSKHIMSKAGVPIIEGYHGEDQSSETLKKEAARIGYPVMIKAVRGGGGKGMRIVLKEDNFEEALESARSESQKAFGDSVVLLEKFVEEPRHVEVQVFADSHGNAVYLYERDCSVQRRHQKVIEEAPAPGLPPDLRKELGIAAVRAAQAVGYVGAGTVEFILDRKNLSFHFMEMNTRLQVEHPITEMITGVDLVEWQIKVAAGKKLPLKQDDIPLKGHSFEARIYAEDPSAGFLPGAGRLEYLLSPVLDDSTRVETGVRQGDEVSVHYDPMIAKLVVWGPNRQDALAKLNTKLLEYNIAGLETNINFLLDLANHEEFKAGNVHTNFIRDNYDTLFQSRTPTKENLIQTSAALILSDKALEMEIALKRRDTFNPFVLESNFRINYHHTRQIKFKYQDRDYNVQVKYLHKENEYEISCDNGQTWDRIHATLSNNENRHVLNCCINGHTTKANFFSQPGYLTIFNECGKIKFALPKTFYNLEDDSDDSLGSNKAVAPMPGVLEKIFVKVGDAVKKGDSLFVLIAMKMEHIVKASRDGKVSNISFKAGDSVLKDATVVQFDEAGN